MVDVTEILAHWYAGRSKNQIAESLGLDRKTVRYPELGITDRLTVTAQVAGDRGDRPPPAGQSMNFHIFSLCEH